MEQMCPACNRRYVEDEVFCEDCGDELIPATTPWRKYALMGLPAIIVIVGIVAGISYVRNDVSNNIKVQLAHPTYSNGAVQVNADVENNSMADVTVDSVIFHAALLGNSFDVTPSFKPTEVAKGKSTSVKAEFSLASVSSPKANTASSVQVVEIRAHVWGFPVSAKIDPNIDTSVLALSGDSILAMLTPQLPSPPAMEQAPGPRPTARPAPQKPPAVRTTPAPVERRTPSKPVDPFSHDSEKAHQDLKSLAKDTKKLIQNNDPFSH